MKNKRDVKKLGYRVKRSTIVLALASHELKTQKFAPLIKSLEKVRDENFDFDRVPDKHLENVYGFLDNAITEKVLAEFRFIPRIGNVRDLGGCVGVCALCGKGDSKDEGGNEDHLRYEFKLTNQAGGEDVWTGSTCIVNHHLKVDGAANSEEAKAILTKALRQHIALWKQEAWRAEHGDHVDIPEQWSRFRFLPRQLDPWGLFGRYDVELSVVGIKRDELKHAAHRLFRPFRSATRFYERKSFLSPSKTETWLEAKSVLRQVKLADSLIREAQGITEPEARLAFFEGKAKELRTRKPRALDSVAA